MLVIPHRRVLSIPDRIAAMGDRAQTRSAASPAAAAGAGRAHPRRAPKRARRASRPSADASPTASGVPAPQPLETDVRAGPLFALAGLLRELGCDPAPAFAAGGLPVDAFDDVERRVPFRVAATVLQRAVQISGRDDLGLLIGQRFRVEHFGLLGNLMQRARTVGEALHDLQRFFHLHDRGAAVYLSRRGAGSVALGYSLLDAETPGIGIAYDLAIAVGGQLLRGLAGPDFAPREVALMRPVPRRPAAYRRCFGAPVGFEAPHSEIRFDARWLDAPVVGTDGRTHAAARRVALSAEPAVAPTLAARAQAAAQVLLAGGAASAAQLADAFGLHERTLRRRLAREGSSFNAVVAAARFELARQLLRETRLPLAAVADALGYADAPAFVRAFRGWAGCTPGRWRAAAQQG